jgi:hypothetical protein
MYIYVQNNNSIWGGGISVSLPREWIQGINHMMAMYFTHGLFLTCTQKSCLYLHDMHLGIYTM